MIKVDVLNTKAEKVNEIELPEDIFGLEYNGPLVHQVVVAQLANKRQGTKSTLTRTEVRGGGAKPWRQKGTGRARQGSIRAPQWIKGGVVFAPKPRDFTKKINKRMKTIALFIALSKKLSDGDIIVLKSFEIEQPKTKQIVNILNKLGLEKKIQLYLDGVGEDIKRASSNLQEFNAFDIQLINVYDIVRAGKCVFTEDAINRLLEVYA
ncbi:MAG: 50S ribosomal protein L4 [Christensenellaceae bacterium]|jgi:large subunit ribosomal protein L4|nr:50S ribosomal protein L4 [Christensenellaceae bacterium]